MYLFALFVNFYLDCISFRYYHAFMSDTSDSTIREQAAHLQDGAKEKPITIRLKLKDGDYRRLCEVARKQGCRTEELVERGVRRLLET